MKSKNRGRLLALAAALVLCGAGCGREPEPPEPVRVTLMHGWGGASRDHVAMRAIYEDFQKQAPDIELTFDASPDILVVLEKADGLLAADRMPNIVSTNGYGNFVRNVRARDKALDLSPYIEADPVFRSDVNDSVLKTWREEDGGVYTLPDALEVLGYWYNEDILRAAGVTQDGSPDSPARLPQTFPELWDACDRIAAWARESGSGVTPVILDPDQARVLLGARIAAGSPGGAAFMKKQRADCPPADLEAAMDDMERAYSYYHYKGEVPNVNDTRQFFFQGQTALYFNGVWASVELEQVQNPPNVRCAPYPGADGSTVSYISSSSGYVIGNTESERKIEASVRFLKYMLSEEVQRRIAAETRQAPSNPKVDAQWIASRAPALGHALAECYGAGTHILAFNTVLDERRMGMLDRFSALPQPGDASRQALRNALCSAPSGEQNKANR